MANENLTISIALENDVPVAAASSNSFALAAEEVLTIEAKPADGAGFVPFIQIESLTFFASGGSVPIARFGLDEAQSPPPGIAWAWARLHNGGAASGEYALEVRGRAADSASRWQVQVALSVAAAEELSAVDPEVADAPQDSYLQRLQINVLSTDGRTFSSHSSTVFDLSPPGASNSSDQLMVNLGVGPGLGLSHPGLTRFFLRDALTGREVSDYGLPAMARMPPGITFSAIALHHDGTDRAAHYLVSFFGTVRSAAPLPAILGWYSDPELILRTTGLPGG